MSVGYGHEVEFPLPQANVESVANRESVHNEPPTALSTRREVSGL